MQILLGAHETIIKINSKATSVDYIQHFINSYFKDTIIKDNYIFLPESSKKCCHRVFLLKWLYTLYAKKSSVHLPELKKLLIDRQNKPIKIVLPKRIIYKIIYTVIDSETLHVQVRPLNTQIINKFTTLLSADTTNLPAYISITIKDEKDKEFFKEFINSEDMIMQPHKHVYNEQKMQDFMKEEPINQLDTAYLIFGLTPSDDTKALKRRYRKLAMQYHPDRASTQDEETIKTYTRKFQTIVHAYEVLSQRAC